MLLRGTNLTLCALCLCISAPAWAQPTVALLPPVLEGELTAEVSADVEAALVRGLSQRSTLPLVLSLEVTSSSPSDCAEGEPCLLAACRAAEVDVAVRVTVSQEGQVYSVQVHLLDVSGGGVLGTESSSCPVCTFGEALDAVAHAGEAASSSMPSILTITGAPEGAQLRVDGVLRGAAGRTLVSPGPHSIEIVSPDAPASQHDVDVPVAGELEVAASHAPVPVEAPLPPVPEADDVHVRPTLLWGWLTAGAAVAALVPGVLWLALEGRCVIGAPEERGLCVDVYATWPQGLAMTAVGVAAAVTSTVLFVVDARQRRSTPRAEAFTVGAAPAAGGGALWLAGRF